VDSTRWDRVQELFEAALDRPETERPDFVREAAGDDEIAAEVLSLLDADARPLDALDTPIVALSEGGPTSADGLAWTPELEPGARLGPWRIEETLGAGGMGVVYRAVRVEGGFEQEVAIKRVRRGMDSRRILRRFEAERAILAGLQHENIARLLDGGLAEDGLPYFVVEYVRGRPIDRYCDEEKLTVEERLELFVAVCRAVLHAHANLVVHRDLKPANILVTDEGVPKLLDFGIARLLDGEEAPEGRTRLTQVGERILTPDYASPEQFRGETIGTASDVYSLGVILYELLVGDRPPAPDPATGRTSVARPSTAGSLSSEGERARTVGEARRVSPERLRRRVAGDLDLICLMALRDEPARRYASVDALADDLERHRRGFPVRARPDTLGYRISRFVRRNRAAVSAAAAGLALLLTSSAIYTARLAAERDRARIEAERAERVADFLAGILETEEGEASAKDLLDAGAARLERELADQPEVLGRLREVVGRAYLSLGEDEAALAQFERAVEEMGEPAQGADEAAWIDYWNARVRVALGLNSVGRTEESIALYREVLDERIAGLGTHLSVASGHYELARALGLAEDADAALEAYAASFAVLDALERRGDDVRDERRITLLALGDQLTANGDAAGALEAITEADSIAEALHGELHSSRLEARLAMSWATRMLGDDDAFEAHLDRAEALGRELYPEGSFERIETLKAIADSRSGAAQRTRATALYEEVATQAATYLGPTHEFVDRSYAAIAELHVRLRRPAEALPYAERAMEVTGRRVGRVHTLYARELSRLGQIHLILGDPVAAIPWLEEGAAVRRELGHPALGNALEGLGAAYLSAGRHAEALEALEESLERTRPSLDRARLEGRIGTVYEQMGEMATAIPILTRSLETLEAEFPADHPVPSSVRRALERARAG
jgi:serine/threonine-protein kinase